MNLDIWTLKSKESSSRLFVALTEWKKLEESKSPILCDDQYEKIFIAIHKFLWNHAFLDLILIWNHEKWVGFDW